MLDKGAIAESGTHKELMAREKGIYRRIFDIQMSDPDRQETPEEVMA